MTVDDVTDLRLSYRTHLEEQLAGVVSYTPHTHQLKNQWSGMVWPASRLAERSPDTGAPEDILRKVGKASVTISSDTFVRDVRSPHALTDPPSWQEIHPRLKRHVRSRLDKVESGQGLDWATAEVSLL